MLSTPAPEQDEPGRQPYYPLRIVDVTAIGLFWLLVALISAASRQLDPRIPGIPPRVMNAVLLSTYVEYALWALLTIPLWWLASRYTIERHRYGRLVFFLALGISIAMVMDSLLLDVREMLISAVRFRRRSPAPLIGLGFLDDLMIYFAVLGAGVARDVLLRNRAQIRKTARLQAQLAQARLDALRSQINPHFLFNTLNAVSAMVERDPRGTRRMIARLSELLRYTLEESTQQEVTLRRELDLLEEYVELMQIRFQGRLEVRMEIDAQTRDALVPNLILQPIVENAIKHGVSRFGEDAGGRIVISASRAGDRLSVVIADNGPGPDAGGGQGIGLANSNARLRAMYGAGSAVILRSGATGGAEAELVLPFHTAPLADGFLVETP